jgi:hypothetical protein
LFIHPNPTSGYIFIKGTETKTAEIKITNVVGGCVYSKHCKPQGELREQIEMSAYPKGVYLVEVSTEKGKEVRKIILE